MRFENRCGAPITQSYAEFLESNESYVNLRDDGNLLLITSPVDQGGMSFTYYLIKLQKANFDTF